MTPKEKWEYEYKVEIEHTESEDENGFRIDVNCDKNTHRYIHRVIDWVVYGLRAVIKFFH